MLMKTIAFLNQKGGVGKTSSCFHLAGALAKLGLRVLLVDNDPQASLTQGIFGPSAVEELHPERSIAAIYSGEGYADRLLVATPFGGIDLIPGSWALTDHNQPVGDDPSRCTRLAESLDVDLAGTDVDIVLIDCPPNLNACSVAALVAAQGLVIPVQAEDYGSQGLASVRRAAALVRVTGHNRNLATLGYLVTMYDARTSLHQGYDLQLREMYGPAVFESRMPRSIDFAEAILHRKPVGLHKPRGKAAAAAADVAAELLLRLESPPATAEPMEVADHV
jgi:chromosome partitioning protein